MIDWQVVGHALPLIGSATTAGTSHDDLRKWLAGNRTAVQNYLTTFGAILLRGFSIGHAQQFHDIARMFCSQFSNYVGGDSPRTRVANDVFTSTEYPRQARIVMHNEGSYLRRMPSRILLFCVQPAVAGGQTPLADCRRVFDRIDVAVRERFKRHGILYVHTLHGGTGIGRSWMQVFDSENRADAEMCIRKDGYAFEWRPDGSLRVFMYGPATMFHPETRAESWINQAVPWHPSTLAEAVGEQVLSAINEEELSHNAFFGDGTPIPPEDLKQIRGAMAAEERIFRWERGDVLVCDNYLVMHGRQSFSGERKVLASIGWGESHHCVDTSSVNA